MNASAGQVVVMSAPNGARRGKADHPALPVQVAEIAAEAAAVRAAGAAALHLHVRDAAGAHSLDPGLYRDALAAAAETAPDLPVQITTETVGRYGPADAHRVLEALRPAAASVALRDLAPTPEDEPAARARFAWAAEARMGLQHIVFAPAEIARVARLAPADEPVSLLFVLGRYADDLTADPGDLAGFLTALAAGPLRERAVWSVCAFGRTERAALVAAAALGGHVRVGFENSLLEPSGAVADTNAAQVSALTAQLAGLALQPADPTDPVTQAVLGRAGG